MLWFQCLPPGLLLALMAKEYSSDSCHNCMFGTPFSQYTDAALVWVRQYFIQFIVATYTHPTWSKDKYLEIIFSQQYPTYSLDIISLFLIPEIKLYKPHGTFKLGKFLSPCVHYPRPLTRNAWVCSKSGSDYTSATCISKHVLIALLQNGLYSWVIYQTHSNILWEFHVSN